MKTELKKWALLFGLLSIISVSCKKEIIYSNANHNSPNKSIEQSTNDVAFENKVTSFIKRCDAFKAGRIAEERDSLRPDSAIWLIEAALNYAYAYPDLTFENTRSDSDTVVLYRNQLSNLMSFNEAIIQFWHTHTSLKSFYDNLVSNDKKLISVNLEKISRLPAPRTPRCPS